MSDPITPFSLKDAPALIERLLPVQKLSAEAYKEQMANQGNRAEAISLWEKLLAYHPDDGVLHWDLAIAYAQQGDKKLAAYHLQLAQALGQQAPAQSANEKDFQ